MQFAVEYFAAGGRHSERAALRAGSGGGAAAGGDGAGGPRSETADGQIAAAAGVAAGILARGLSLASGEELEALIASIFQRADKDSSGALDATEFRDCIHSIAEQLTLDAASARQLMSLADSNADGLVQYPEFIPVAVQLIGMVAAAQANAAAADALKARAFDTAQYILVHGMTPQEVTARMMDAFIAADTDNDSLISRDELQAALASSPIGLSRKDINLLMAEVCTHCWRRSTVGGGILPYRTISRLCWCWRCAG